MANDATKGLNINDDVRQALFGNDSITEAEDKFYKKYLEKAMGYIDGNVDGVGFKQMSVACGNVGKMRQARGSAAALKYKVAKDNLFNKE